jgi:hypothetical protein
MSKIPTEQVIANTDNLRILSNQRFEMLETASPKEAPSESKFKGFDQLDEENLIENARSIQYFFRRLAINILNTRSNKYLNFRIERDPIPDVHYELALLEHCFGWFFEAFFILSNRLGKKKANFLIQRIFYSVTGGFPELPVQNSNHMGELLVEAHPLAVFFALIRLMVDFAQEVTLPETFKYNSSVLDPKQNFMTIRILRLLGIRYLDTNQPEP